MVRKMPEIWINKCFWAEFIELYSNNPSVWNVKSKLYPDRNSRNKAYEVLVEKLK